MAKGTRRKFAMSMRRNRVKDMGKKMMTKILEKNVA